MKKTLMIVFLLSACSLVLAAAQSQNMPPQGMPQIQQQTAPSSVQEMKMTGCLMRGAEPNSFVLSHVTPVEVTQQGRTSRLPSEMPRTETSYTLIPEGRMDLSRHVGKKVEVTGRMLQMPQQLPRATVPGEMPARSQFKVSSIRQIADTCP